MDTPDTLILRRQPTITDVAMVHDAIASQEKAIAVLDTEIEGLMRSVRRLTHQKSQHQSQIRHFKGLITLATRIPSELLAIVFEHAASDWAKAPMVLSHVCSAWRAGTTLPGVWSHIYINFDSRDPYGRAKYWLSKVQQAPVYITLEVSSDGSYLERVMDLLLKYIAQWRSFTINTLLSQQANYIISRCGAYAPQLRRVDIRTDLERRDADEVEEQLVGFREAFSDAKCLRTVHLSRELSPAVNILPESITNLYLHLPSWSGPATLSAANVILLLESLPRLKIFSMEFPAHHERTFTAPPADAAQRAVVPHLEFLTLVLSPDCNAILSCIDAPALRSLHIRSSGEPTGVAHTITGTHLLRFLEHSEPQLEILELHDIDVSIDTFTSCLELLPHLKELRLHESEITDGVIEQLSGPNPFWPRLQKLDFRWCGLVTGRGLVNLVRSRQNLTEAILEVAVLNCSFVREDEIMELAKMTRCRVVMEPLGDLCRIKGCCNNERYRQRLKLRNLINSAKHQRPRINLIL